MFKNVALHKPVTMSSQYEGFAGANATNGLFNTFCHTQCEKGAWVEVDLEGTYFVSAVRVVNRNDGQCEDRLGRFKLVFDGTPYGSFSYTQMTGKAPAMLIHVNTVTSKVKVQLKGENYLHLTQIEVYGVEVSQKPGDSWGFAPTLVDVAEGKAVTMSSQYEGFDGSRATSGNLNSFCHTEKQDDPWVTVDLGANYFVVYVEVYNRGDKQFEDRLGNFKVSFDGVDSGYDFKYTEMYGKPTRVVVPVGKNISKVTVTLVGHNYLHLAAVRAVGFANF